jgi:hypothetical protein
VNLLFADQSSHESAGRVGLDAASTQANAPARAWRGASLSIAIGCLIGYERMVMYYTSLLTATTRTVVF